MKRLMMELDDMEISYKNSSNLQGVLFEHISEKYAEILHRQQRHPYSQYVLKTKDKVTWCNRSTWFESLFWFSSS